jgi:DNA polymerase-3 subunit alpha
MPDFDIDFCQDNRWRVIEYVREKYGAEAVSQIATFGTMSSKAVIRDVGRVLRSALRCATAFQADPGRPEQAGVAGRGAGAGAAAQGNDGRRRGETIRELFDLAGRLEDLTRNVGMHAGGVLIAPGKITDFCPIYRPTAAMLRRCRSSTRTTSRRSAW